MPPSYSIEPVRGFDLTHFLARRHIDAALRLDGEFLLGRRLEQVNPQYVRERRVADAGQALALQRLAVEHRRCAGGKT